MKDRESRFTPTINPWIQPDFDSSVSDKMLDSRLLAKKREENRDRIEAQREIDLRGTPWDVRMKR